MTDIYERLYYATETFYKAMEAHREWMKSKKRAQLPKEAPY